MSVRDQDSFFSSKFRDGIHIPAALLVVGIAVVKVQWTPYAVVVAALLSGVKFFLRGPWPALDPNEYQSYMLIDKIPIEGPQFHTAIYRFELAAKKGSWNSILAPSTDKLVMGLPTGQHVLVKGTHAGKEGWKKYTPITDDHTRGSFDLLVKSYPAGHMSQVFQNLRIGQSLDFKGPDGKMVYRSNMAKHIIMVAGGTGITPMLQIIKAIVRDESDFTQVDLFFANQTIKEILVKSELDAVAKNAPNGNIRVHYGVDKEAPENWPGFQGFVTADMIKNTLEKAAPDVWSFPVDGPQPDTHRFYMCGPTPMTGAMKKVAKELKYATKPLDHKKSGNDQIFSF